MEHDGLSISLHRSLRIWRKIVVKDNGGGINEEIIDKIFEPYFTTKEQGKGTGVSVFICQSYRKM